MTAQLDEATSVEVAKAVNSKAKTPFENAYRAALATDGAQYVQGFLVMVGRPNKLVEHGWIEVNETIIDPTLPHFQKASPELCYFPAQRLSLKRLKAIVEESQEDYPEDDPLPIYGDPPYEYYGDVMLGGQDYLEAYQQAEAKLKELNQESAERN